MLKPIKSDTNYSAILSKISRIPQRVYADFRLIALLKNWQEAIEAKLTGKPLPTLYFRNGIVLNGSNTNFWGFPLKNFWIYEIYNYSGYPIKSGDVIMDTRAIIGSFSTYAATRIFKEQEEELNVQGITLEEILIKKLKDATLLN